MVDEVVGGFEDTAGKPVFAHELPGVLGRIQLGGSWRQEHYGDVGGKVELGGAVPARLIDQQDCMGIGGDDLVNLGEMQVHRRGLAEQQD